MRRNKKLFLYRLLLNKSAPRPTRPSGILFKEARSKKQEKKQEARPFTFFVLLLGSYHLASVKRYSVKREFGVLRNNNKFLFITFLALFFVSCDRNKIYEKYQSIPNGVWNTKEPVKFDFEAKDTTQYCNMLVNIRCSDNYPYRNLYMFMKTTRPDGTKSIDTLEFYLLDIKGKPLGDCSGDICNSRFMIDHDFKFPLPGRYEFEFQQAMRTEDGNLPLVFDVGLRLEKAAKKNQ